MAQKLAPVEKLNRGVGIADLKAAGVAATSTTLTWNNTGDQMLFLHNGTGGAVNATLKATPDPFGRGGATVNDEVISLAAGEMGMFPFASPSMFNDGQIATVELANLTSITATLVTQRKS